MILGKDGALIFFYSQIPSNRSINVKADDGLDFQKHFNFMYMCLCAHVNATATCWYQRIAFRKSIFSTMWVPGIGLWTSGLAARAFICQAILSAVLDVFILCIWNNILLLFLLLCFSYFFKNNIFLFHVHLFFVCVKVLDPLNWSSRQL